MSFFDEFLTSHVTDETDRSVILKYPALRETLDTVVDLNRKNQSWLALHWDDAAGKTFREKELEEALAQRQSSAASVAAGGNQDMTFEEIEAQLKVKGYVSAERVSELINTAKTEVAENLHRRDIGTMIFTGHVANLARKHHDEFGEDLDVKGFAEHVSSSGAQDPLDAYNHYVATKRADVTTKKLADMQAQSAADAERIKQEGIQEGRRIAMQEVAQNGGNPVDQGSRAGTVGWMQQRQIDRNQRTDADGNQAVPAGRLGDGSATAAIMAQLAKDRANNTVPTAIN